MTLVSNLDLEFYHAMEKVCENFRSIAYCIVKLKLVKDRKLDVCGNLVLSNSVTFINLAV